MNLRGHLDMVRVLPRVFRRAGLSLYYTEGFSPRPVLVFGPALALGVQSIAEYVDFSLTEERPEDELLSALQGASEGGLGFVGLRRLSESEPALGKRIDRVGYLVRLPAEPADADALSYSTRLDTFERAPSFAVEVSRKGKRRSIDAKTVVLRAALTAAGETAALWGGAPEERVLELHLAESSSAPSLKPIEVVKAVLDVDITPTALVRVGCWARHGDSNELRSPLERALTIVPPSLAASAGQPQILAEAGSSEL